MLARRLLVAPVLALTLAAFTPAHADPASKAKIAAALHSSTSGQEPLMGFFLALIDVDDLDLTAQEMREVAVSSGLWNSPAKPVLASIRHVTKVGGSVTIQTVGDDTESKIIVDGVEKGGLRTAAGVSLTATRTADGGIISNIDGVEVSTTTSPWADLKKIVFTHENGKAVAVATVKWGIFTKTITIPMKAKPASPPATSTTTTATSAPHTPSAPSNPTTGFLPSIGGGNQ